MKIISRLFVSSLFAGAVALASSTAHAESTRGAGYVQGNVLGYTTFLNSFGGSAYPLEIHGGYHIGGTHEGFVIGATQKFLFASGGFVGATVARAGYDIAIPIKEFELTVAPYGYAGISYGDALGEARVHFGFGAEARFFPLVEGAGKGFFATARPFEIGFMPGTGTTFVPYNFSLGAGYAF